MKYSEKNKPIVCMQTNNQCYKNTSKMTPKGVLWHDTSAGNPYISRYVQPLETDDNYDEMIALLGKNKHNNDWNHTNRKAGLNCWIGKLADGTITTVQTMPWDYRPWGCGSGKKGSLNNVCMQFEICDDNRVSKDYFEACYKEACEITAYYCQMYGLNPLGTFEYKGVTVPVITTHDESYDLGLGNDHGDPIKWMKVFGKTMKDARRDVAKLMGIDVDSQTGTATTPTTPAAPTIPTKEELKYTKIEPKEEDIYDKNKTVKFATNFFSGQFNCQGKNCCSKTIIDKELKDYLVDIRNHFGRAIRVLKGYTCEESVKKLDEPADEYHLNGMAADISVSNISPLEVARYAEQIGVKGIGLYEGVEGDYVHLDTRDTKLFWYGSSQIKRETFQPEQKEPQKVVVNANKLNVRENTNITSKVKKVIPMGTVCTIVEEKQGWGRLANGEGWIMLRYVTEK